MNLDINYHNKNLVNTLSKDLIYDQMWKHKLKHGTIIYLDNDYLTERFHARKVDDEKALYYFVVFLIVTQIKQIILFISKIV